MISFNKLDDVSPTDPLYYAPRQPRSVKDLSSKPFVVPEDAWAERQPERQPVKAMPHPLSPEIVPAPPENALQRLSRQTKWRIAAAGAAAIVVAAVLAFVAVGMLPPSEKTEASALPPIVAATGAGDLVADADKMQPGDVAAKSDSPAIVQDASVQAASDKSDALLQQFLSWDKNAASPRAP
jgi:negative regulator of sigma E activity